MKRRSPRSGSMQFWPRKRAKKVVARVRAWQPTKDVKPLGFLCYKVGMAHIMATEKNAKKPFTRAIPCTILECPPLSIVSVRFYKNNQVLTEVLNPKCNDEVKRKLSLPKSSDKKMDDVQDYDEIRLLCASQPGKTTIGKKKPDLFEVPLGGKEQLEWVKENLDKEINAKDLIEEKSQVDVHAVTRGKGYQGVIKRFGVSLKAKKSEKGQRGVGARSGGWTGRQHMMYRVAQPGKMGHHLRTEYNKYVLKVDEADINPGKGFRHYGKIKNPYIILKGSVAGPAKRVVTLTAAQRPSKKIKRTNIDIQEVVA